MILSKMRFKGYAWLHNPKTLKLENGAKLREDYLFQKCCMITEESSKPTVVKGTGQLYGEDCLKQYAELLKLQAKGGSGILSLPETRPFYAFFKSISLDCDPTPDLITYSFEFVEDMSKRPLGDTQYYHKVLEGETLWDISFNYDVPIERLVELNPQLKRTDELLSGEQVRVC